MNFEEKIEHGMKLYRVIPSGQGPTKLFVSGLHGREGDHTAQILEKLTEVEIEEICGKEVIIVPRVATESRYIHVLYEEYYKSREGKKLIYLIKKYRPSFYFEVHSYRKESYFILTDPEREDKFGVPPFVDLQDGILLGSIAPVLRSRFEKSDLCLTIELPNWKIQEVREYIMDILRLFLRKENRNDLIEALRRIYPSQIKIAEEVFRKYYRDRLNPF
jgi:hypothetical protein